MMPATWFAIVCRKVDLAALELAQLDGLDVHHADDLVPDDERHREHRREPLLVDGAHPLEPRLVTDVAHRERHARVRDPAGDALADAQRRLPDPAPIEAVRRGETQDAVAPFDEVERRDLGAHRVGRTVDHDAQHLVPVAGRGGELRDLPEERQLGEFPLGIGVGECRHRRILGTCSKYTPAMGVVLRTERLTKRFERLTAVQDLDLEVREGEVFGFLGPNGAGKTTTLRLLCALIAPTSGTAEVAGYRLGRDDEQIRASVGILTEQPGLYERQSAQDNLLFFAELFGLSPRSPARRPSGTCGSWASGIAGPRPSRRSRAG